MRCLSRPQSRRQLVWTQRLLAKLASEFIAQGIFDEILIYQAPLLVGGANVAVTDIGIDTMQKALELNFTEVKQLGDDIFIRAVPKESK